MVANIEDDGLLGHDLLRQGRAAILYNKNILRFMGASLPCIKISNILYRRRQMSPSKFSLNNIYFDINKHGYNLQW